MNIIKKKMYSKRRKMLEWRRQESLKDSWRYLIDIISSLKKKKNQGEQMIEIFDKKLKNYMKSNKISNQKAYHVFKANIRQKPLDFGLDQMHITAYRRI